MPDISELLQKMVAVHRRRILPPGFPPLAGLQNLTELCDDGKGSNSKLFVVDLPGLKPTPKECLKLSLPLEHVKKLVPVENVWFLQELDELVEIQLRKIIFLQGFHRLSMDLLRLR